MMLSPTDLTLQDYINLQATTNQGVAVHNVIAVEGKFHNKILLFLFLNLLYYNIQTL